MTVSTSGGTARDNRRAGRRSPAPLPHRQRRRVGALLALGATSHLIADALLLTASGHSYPLRWPLTDVAPATPGFYLSTDGWPSVALGTLALAIWPVDRRVVQTDGWSNPTRPGRDPPTRLAKAEWQAGDASTPGTSGQRDWLGPNDVIGYGRPRPPLRIWLQSPAVVVLVPLQP
ncbi:MAG: hypothetical protein V5A43_12280 [Haloarculaceae archaeon]